MINKVILFLLIFLASATKGQTPKLLLRPYSPIVDFPEKQNRHAHLKDLDVFDASYLSSDGTLIKGFVIRPTDTLKKYPVILFNRGGNGAYGMVTEQYIVNFLSRIAAKGFIVAGSQLRGSEGSQGIDEFGGKSIGDVRTFLDLVKALPYADSSRIAQIGWSRGAITNFLLLKEMPNINPTITIGGQSNILDTNRKIMFEVYRNRVPGYAADSVAASHAISPLYQLDSINKHSRLLFVHGTADEKVSVSHGRTMHRAALEKGLLSELWEYEGGDHSLRRYFHALAARISEWLRHIFY